jgi:molybdopterin converting factor subunit 1
MTIKIKLFALLRDAAGAGEITLDLPADATVGTAAEHLIERFPQLESHLPRCAFAVNFEYASLGEPLHDGDELAAIPPVSGG